MVRAGTAASRLVQRPTEERLTPALEPGDAHRPQPRRTPGRTGDTHNGASGPTSSAPSLSPSKSKTRTPTPTAPPSSPIQNGPPTNQELATAVVDYFTLVPGNLDAGWARLTPHFQSTKAHNRQTFDNFWNSVQRVSVRNARGEPPNGATATLTYHYKDGRVVTEQTHFSFVRQDGVLKIDGEN